MQVVAYVGTSDDHVALPNVFNLSIRVSLYF